MSAPDRKWKHVLFVIPTAIGLILFRDPLRELVALSSTSELYQHIPLIPLVSGYFLFLHRKDFPAISYGSPWAGTAGVAAGLSLFLLGGWIEPGLSRNDYLSLMMAGLVLWTLASFVLAYGMGGLKTCLFPMLFLVFIIPVPGFILDPAVTFLQTASAEVSDLIFMLTGVPFLRDGMVFTLPGIEVEVARECSGIRSSLALVITALIAGSLSLRFSWSKGALVAAILPVTIFKNGLRIVTLSLLGSYVDPVFITGHWLHRSGGIPFFVVGLILLIPVLWILRRIESRCPSASTDLSRRSPKPEGMIGRRFRNETGRGF